MFLINADYIIYNSKYLFIHSGHFYSAPSSPLLLRGAPDYSTDTVSEFHAETHLYFSICYKKMSILAIFHIYFFVLFERSRATPRGFFGPLFGPGPRRGG